MTFGGEAVARLPAPTIDRHEERAEHILRDGDWFLSGLHAEAKYTNLVRKQGTNSDVMPILVS
jgi:hypothetical protein